MELTQKTEEELILLLNQINAEMKLRREARIKQLRNDLKKAAEELGVSLEEIIKGSSGGPRGPRGKVAPKYRNPSNPEQTWTGRGKKPAWVLHALANGQTLDQMMIR